MKFYCVQIELQYNRVREYLLDSPPTDEKLKMLFLEAILRDPFDLECLRRNPLYPHWENIIIIGRNPKERGEFEAIRDKSPGTVIASFRIQALEPYKEKIERFLTHKEPFVRKVARQ